MRTSLLLLLLLVPLVGGTQLGRTAAANQGPGAMADPILKQCLVSVKQQVRLPAEEPGVLRALEGREGMQVKRDTVIANIDASTSKIERRIKELELKVEQETARNDVNIRFAAASKDVAKAEYDQNAEANKAVRGSVPAVELNRLRLVWRKAELQIEQAQLEQKIARLKSESKQAEVEAALLSIQRRQIKAPFDGVVVETYREVGEWVPAGEPVIRVVRLDQLRIKGSLEASAYDPAEIAGCGVTVEVELARGRKARATGKVAVVSQEVQLDGSYEVWADVQNTTENDQFVLRPGMSAKMRIHLDKNAARQAAMR